MTRTAPLALLLAVSLADDASAQLVEVPGDHADLQTAIDLVAPGTTILIHGGQYEAIVIDKPLTLIGDPPPYITPGGSNPALAEAAIRLVGPGAGTVRLVDLLIGGTVYGGFFSASEPSIAGGGFDQLEVFDSIVEGAPWAFAYNVVFPGADAIDVTVPLVWIERCTVQGAHAANADNSAVTQAEDAGTAIRASGTVVVLDSTVAGGNGAYCRYDSSGANTCPPTCPGGAGGHGVVCQRLVHSNSTFSAGVGSSWHDELGTAFCCQGPAGTAKIVANETTLTNNLSVSGPAVLGQTLTLQWNPQGPIALLFLANGFVPPPATGTPLFLAPPLLFVAGVPAPGNVGAMVPNAPALTGYGYGFQLYAAAGWTRPAGGVVSP